MNGEQIAALTPLQIIALQSGQFAAFSQAQVKALQEQIEKQKAANKQIEDQIALLKERLKADVCTIKDPLGKGPASTPAPAGALPERKTDATPPGGPVTPTAASAELPKGGGKAGKLDPPALARALEQATVLVVSAGGDSGSGFFVAPDLVVTNHHVVDGPGRTVVRVPASASDPSANAVGTPGALAVSGAMRNVPAEVVAADPKQDIALLKVDPTAFAAFTPLPLGGERVRRGRIGVAHAGRERGRQPLAYVDDGLAPVTDAAEVASIAAEIARCGWFALDLEFMTEGRYVAELSLVQVGWGDHDTPTVAAIDLVRAAPGTGDHGGAHPAPTTESGGSAPQDPPRGGIAEAIFAVPFAAD